MMNAKGTFEVKMSADPPYEVIEGVSCGRAKFDKRFSGPLDATSTVEMIGVQTPVKGSAVYVAIERVSGTLGGKAGTFVLYHTGRMAGGESRLDVGVAPDSATGELQGLRGQMTIDIVDGHHFYSFEYSLEAP